MHDLGSCRPGKAPLKTQGRFRDSTKKTTSKKTRTSTVSQLVKRKAKRSQRHTKQPPVCNAAPPVPSENSAPSALRDHRSPRCTQQSPHNQIPGSQQVAAGKWWGRWWDSGTPTKKNASEFGQFLLGSFLKTTQFFRVPTCFFYGWWSFDYKYLRNNMRKSSRINFWDPTNRSPKKSTFCVGLGPGSPSRIHFASSLIDYFVQPCDFLSRGWMIFLEGLTLTEN